jgi:hypothetical protein
MQHHRSRTTACRRRLTASATLRLPAAPDAWRSTARPRVGWERGGAGHGRTGVRQTRAAGVHTGCWRAHGWLEGGRRAVGAQGRGAVWAGVAQSNNRLHPTPGVDIGGRRSVRPARVKLGR